MVRKKTTEAAAETAEKKETTKKSTTRRTTARRTTKKKKEEEPIPVADTEATSIPEEVPVEAPGTNTVPSEQPAESAADQQADDLVAASPATEEEVVKTESIPVSEVEEEAHDESASLSQQESNNLTETAVEPSIMGALATAGKAADTLPPMGARSSVRVPWTSVPLSAIHDFCDLVNQSGRMSLLSDQQIQQLSYDEVVERSETLERILCQVLNYDIVLSDTNIWIELLVGHTSSHSDPRVNARLQFERQLEFLSKMMKRIGGRFMIMSETYEEVDRFATAQDPVNYKEADWNDEDLCRNVAARLAKRLMLAQQKENRLRIEGIGSENHHSAFADPAIIRRTVELFAQGRKVLLLTNDASVGIRSLGMCDDLQRVNKIDDRTWREVYEPQRPMVLTMEDLKLLDQYTRQYHFLQMAANRQWMQTATERQPAQIEKALELWLDGFRSGDRHDKDRKEQRREQDRREQQRKEQERKEQERKAEQERKEQERQAEMERREAQRKADIERRDAQRRAEQERKEQERKAAEEAATKELAENAKSVAAAEKIAEPVPADKAPTPDTTAEVTDADSASETSSAPAKRSRSHRGGGRRRSSKSAKKD